MNLDARPDYSQWSSDFRMEASVSAALVHIHSFMHPQVYIIDDREQPFFVKQIRAKALETGRSIIELPSDAASRLMWITRLDSGSLKGKSVAFAWLNDILTRTSMGDYLRRYNDSCPP